MDTAPFSLTFIEIPRAPRFFSASFSALRRSNSAFSSCSFIWRVHRTNRPRPSPVSIEERELAVPPGRAPEGGGRLWLAVPAGFRLSPLRIQPQFLAGGAEQAGGGVRVQAFAAPARPPARVVELPAAHL